MLAAVLLGAALWGGAAQAACPEVAAVRKAFEAKDLAAGRQAAAGVVGDRQCIEEERLMVRGIAETIRYNQIAEAVTAGAPMAKFEGELRQIAAGGAPPWQVHDMLGDIDKARKDYNQAAIDYFAALSIGANEATTPDWAAPDADYIRYLDRIGSEMRLAADNPELIATRGGCQISYRGVGITEKTVPIRFVVATPDFTDEGKKSAQALLGCLKSTGASDITLIGHTDPTGSDDFNQHLSEARAKTVGDYLLAQGYNGKIALVGKGEKEPFQPDDASQYDQATLYQMDRRVEVIVNKTP